MRKGNSKRKLPCLTTEQVLTNSLKDQQLKKSNMSKNLSIIISISMNTQTLNPSVPGGLRAQSYNR